MTSTELASTDLENTLLDIAKQCVKQGPGFSQETVVLRQAAELLGIGFDPNGRDLKQQQRLLTAWHNLFRNGTLSWGYDVDNPTSPFFHFVEH